MPGVGFEVGPLISGGVAAAGEELACLEVVCWLCGIMAVVVAVIGTGNGREGSVLLDAEEGGFQMLGLGAGVAGGVLVPGQDLGGGGGAGAGSGVEEGVTWEGVGVVVPALGVLGYDLVAHGCRVCVRN